MYYHLRHVGNQYLFVVGHVFRFMAVQAWDYSPGFGRYLLFQVEYLSFQNKYVFLTAIWYEKTNIGYSLSWLSSLWIYSQPWTYLVWKPMTIGRIISSFVCSIKVVLERKKRLDKFTFIVLMTKTLDISVNSIIYGGLYCHLNWKLSDK